MRRIPKVVGILNSEVAKARELRKKLVLHASDVRVRRSVANHVHPSIGRRERAEGGFTAIVWCAGADKGRTS